MKTEMTDLKRTKKEMKAEMSMPVSNGSEYGWGTQIRLSTEDLKKLNIDVSDLEAGQKILIEAAGKINDISKCEMEGGEKDQSLTIQITAMSLNSDPAQMDNKNYRKWRKA